ncbi:transglutaminase [Acinetobacter sp. NCu2D-2]|uniref:transglutaminase family protein n=1 Tax=Acinetobacter sp. NCu2D-2 TaxID=1608473 RepID=UPI0007CDE09F|nr:transglutaminase family protein [Acinetobacter sp. NCu2D-2]ANF81931.1 transglutaminase [Acinetobacter sp. NCu2D-2]
MKLMVNHQTHYSYTADVTSSIQYIKMMPATNAHQHVQHWHVSVPGQKQLSKDAFDNIWMTSTQREPYQHLSIMAQGIIEIQPSKQDNGMIDQINPNLFLQPTSCTECNAEMKAFAHQYVPQLGRQNLMQLAQAVLERVQYVSNSTSVHASAIDSFNAKQGVCQDHSHIFIAMCKYLGVPARYVSGYLYAQNASHLASHAWAEVYIDQAWYCFDVSNQLFSPSAHIYVAVGRDYWDVAPVRGVREKGGVESMHSLVQVLSC